LPDDATSYTIVEDNWSGITDKKNKRLGTSCCPKDGQGKGKRKVCAGKCCPLGLNYHEAKTKCEDAGMRLCEASEIDLTKSTGCEFDTTLNWVSDSCSTPPPSGPKHYVKLGRSSVQREGKEVKQCLPNGATSYTIDEDNWSEINDKEKKLLGTSCCPKDGQGKGKREVCWGGCCPLGLDYHSAEWICDEGAGMRLCKASEIDLTEGTGCGLDGTLNWVSDIC
jgi:hypothetical protein